jgi:hypothetical protein
MSHITKLAAIETTSAIWEFDPSEPGNRVLGGGVDVIATIRTLAIKVRSCINSDALSFCADLVDIIDTEFGSKNPEIRIHPDRMRDQDASQDHATWQHTLGLRIWYAGSSVQTSRGEFVCGVTPTCDLSVGMVLF